MQREWSKMKRLIAIILVLLVILGGMVIYKKITIKNNNTINLQEIEKIETYITKIYMWKEITNEALPKFDDINKADETWLWETVKKNLEDYELTKEQIEEKAKELFGENFTKEFPTDGTTYLRYNEETGKYNAEGRGLDEEEDSFLLNKIEKTKEGYEVEIIEFLEDYSNMLNEQTSEIILKNLNEEEIAKVNSEDEEQAKEIVKENIDRFSKKKVILKSNEEGQIYVERVE